MQNNASANERQLAITHRFTIRVPSAETEAIQQKHMAECAKLGCTILSTSIDRSNEGRISARASVRIKPDSYEAFAAVLAAPPAQINMRCRRPNCRRRPWPGLSSRQRGRPDGHRFGCRADFHARGHCALASSHSADLVGGRPRRPTLEGTETGAIMPSYDVAASMPAQPAGAEWKEDELGILFPKLSAKFG